MSNLRNFVIISHIDHGKSTLADRLLELTKTVPQEKMKPQYLDMMELERERGVTIKMAPVRMVWRPEKLRNLGPEFILNLIDTPGHIDFYYEVSRSLKAVEGALLLVDASKGIQAQTLFNLTMAQKEGLKIIPVINKIDLPYARIEETERELHKIGFQKENIIKISARTGEKVDAVLKAVIKKIPPPSGDFSAPLKALVFDSVYDPFRGVVAYIRIFNGQVKKGDKIKLLGGGIETNVLEVGYFNPQLKEKTVLSAGEIGYLKTGVKDIRKIKIGDTICLSSTPVTPLAGYHEPQPMVFASFYPLEGQNFEKLKEALWKLRLNDASLTFTPETSKAFGAGFRCGFLGLFHLEIIKERLERDFNLEVVITSPSVDIQKLDDGFVEPYVRVEIITLNKEIGKIMELCHLYRMKILETRDLEKRLILICEAPLSEIMTDFYNHLKNLSQGYASMSYKFIGYRKADLVELNILIAHEKVEALSRIVPRLKAQSIAQEMVKKLKEKIPRHLFEIVIQAAVGKHIIASEKIPALRKDVTAHLYGGDITRKRKLWEKQKAGKKRMKKIGRVNLPSDLFLEL